MRQSLKRPWANQENEASINQRQSQNDENYPPPPPPPCFDMAGLARLVTAIVEQVMAQRDAKNPPSPPHLEQKADVEEIRRL